jgi:hypothetical protein
MWSEGLKRPLYNYQISAMHQEDELNECFSFLFFFLLFFFFFFFLKYMLRIFVMAIYKFIL